MEPVQQFLEDLAFLLGLRPERIADRLVRPGRERTPLDAQPLDGLVAPEPLLAQAEAADPARLVGVDPVGRGRQQVRGGLALLGHNGVDRLVGFGPQQQDLGLDLAGLDQASANTVDAQDYRLRAPGLEGILEAGDNAQRIRWRVLGQVASDLDQGGVVPQPNQGRARTGDQADGQRQQEEQQTERHQGAAQTCDALLAPGLGEGRLGDLLDKFGLKVGAVH